MKRYVVLLLLLPVSLGLFAQSEEMEMYTYLYNGANTVVEQLGVLQNVVDANISDTGDFFPKALTRILREYPDVQRGNSSTEKAAADATVRLLSNVLAEAQYAAAGQDLWRVVQNFSNSLVKSDALIALGKIGAVDLLPQVVLLLSDLNVKPAEDREMAERIAYGAILSLENYKDASGYLPVFFASVGWYSDRIKSQALSSLPKIMADPCEPLTSVIKSPGYTYDVKYAALQIVESSEATSRAKTEVALAAFGEGWRAATGDVRRRGQLASMRKLSSDMIRRYGTEDTSVYPLLERSYKEGIDEEEQLGALATLAALATDDSARLLSSFLMAMNVKLQSGMLVQKDERMVRAIIPALGATGRPIGRPALQSVQAMDWTNAVKNLAAQALRSIR
jgi:hypothetical protein